MGLDQIERDKHKMNEQENWVLGQKLLYHGHRLTKRQIAKLEKLPGWTWTLTDAELLFLAERTNVKPDAGGRN